MCDWINDEGEKVENYLSFSSDVIVTRVTCENGVCIKYSCKKAMMNETVVEKCISKMKKVSNPAIPAYVKHKYEGKGKPFHIYYKDVQQRSCDRSYSVYIYII